MHATFSDPDRPSETLPLVGFFAWTSMPLNMSSSVLCLFPDRANGAEYASGDTVLPVAYMVLCVHFT